jgi:hypothetical protein
MNLTTSFAPNRSPADIIAVVERAMPTGLVLDASLTPAAWDVLTASGVPIVAVEAPAPFTPACRARLLAEDRDEAATALGAVRDTLARAATLGARVAVLRLGAVESFEAEWRAFRDAFHKGSVSTTRARRFAVEREHAAQATVDRALRGLERLARDPEQRGHTLAVNNTPRAVDFPSPNQF